MPADASPGLNRRPIIGVPTQNLQSIGGVPADIPASWAMSHRYVHTLARAGGVPWLIPLLHDDPSTLRAIYESLDGVFLPGGADIDPASYGAERHPLCERSDPPRDQVEFALVRWAREDRKPVFGVCRGLQLINLALGGSIYQDLAEEFPESQKHDYFPFGGAYRRDHLAHAVRVVAPGSRLARILDTDELMVNSMHHQGVCRLADPLVATAHAPDGLIEALEWPEDDHFLLGVQWHPEALTERDATARRLFQAFIAASADWRSAREMAESLR